MKSPAAVLSSHPLDRELAATPIENTPRRERLTWTTRRAERRLAELDARLAREDPARS